MAKIITSSWTTKTLALFAWLKRSRISTLISLAAFVGYWLDRSLFPYARPDGYLLRDWRHGTEEPEFEADYPVLAEHVLPFCVAMLRRAIIVGAVVVGVALGL